MMQHTIKISLAEDLVSQTVPLQAAASSVPAGRVIIDLTGE